MTNGYGNITLYVKSIVKYPGAHTFPCN